MCFFVLSERVDSFKQLSGVKFVPVIPTAMSGRILRREIREKTMQEMGIKPEMSAVADPNNGKGFSSKDYGGRASLL